MSRYCENGACTRPAVMVAQVQGPEQTQLVLRPTALCQDCHDFLVKAEIVIQPLGSK